MICHIDFESRSLLDLRDVGIDRYTKHPTTIPLMLAFAFDDGPVDLWQPHQNRMPSDLNDALRDSQITKAAWNVAFERNILKRCLKIDLPASHFVDAMALARYLSLPSSLEKAGEALGLPKDSAKIKEGKRLIKKFCEPFKLGGTVTLFGVEEDQYHDWEDEPEDWELFCTYCKNDVIAERGVMHRTFSLPDFEQRMWEIDQKINERGLPVNQEFIANCRAMAERHKQELIEKQIAATGLENPNSGDQMLPWAREQGYPYNSLEKGFVKLSTEKPPREMTPLCVEVLNTRKEAAKSSYTKLQKMQEMASDDARLRHQYQFMGAARTGRWSSYDVQVTNLPRPTKEFEKNPQLAYDLIRKADYAGLTENFKSVIGVATSSIRNCFEAPVNKKLAVADLNAIENRLLGWAANCRSILDVFAYGRCPYISFACVLFNDTYEELNAAYEAGDPAAKEKRQIAKAAVLGAGFGLGGGELVKTKKGDIKKSGLWGYAEAMGIEMTREMAHKAVAAFREEYGEAKQFWYDLGAAATRCLVTGQDVPIGPVIFQLAFIGKMRILKLLLPSGRCLHYINPRIESEFRTFKDHRGKERTKEEQVIYYDGIGHGVGATQTKWGPVKTYGAKFCENLIQSIARDVLVNGLLLADEAGIEVVGHCHDEIISIVDPSDVFSPQLEDLVACMESAPKWAKDLPLKAEGFVADYYRK